MEFLFELFPVFFITTFVLIVGVFLFVIVRGLTQWNKNNHSPRLIVDATVVSKRMQIFRSRSGGSIHYHANTRYYVTFQVQSGDRLELPVSGHESGLLVEGDRGRLTFQGTRFLQFDRNIENNG